MPLSIAPLPFKTSWRPMTCTTLTRSGFDRFTLQAASAPLIGVDVYGWGLYPQDSVLAGQARRVFLGNFPTEAAAQAAFPRATTYGDFWLGPRASLMHLPSESDPVAGGMYPDDWAD